MNDTGQKSQSFPFEWINSYRYPNPNSRCSEVWSEVKRSEERKEVLIMAAETLLLSNGAVANGDLSSNPNPNPTKKSRDTERRRRRRKQKKNSMASQAPSSDADSNDPQQVSFLFFSFVWDIGICDSKNA